MKKSPFFVNPSFSDLPSILKALSRDIWERIKFSYLTKILRFNEVYITQDLVYKFYLLAKHCDFPIKIFESNNERTNGNDLEILIEVNEGIIKIPCQAKVIHWSGRFKKINHKVNGELQMDLLLKYAQSIKGYPTYLFYNYHESGDLDKLNLLKPERESWGCTIGSASLIRKRCLALEKFKNPHFFDLHPALCNPLYRLGEVISPLATKDRIQELFTDIDFTKIKLYSTDEISEENQWSSLTSESGLGYLDAPVDLKGEKEFNSEENAFKPRFRILITKNDNRNIIQMLN